jgi:hypothetical protein
VTTRFKDQKARRRALPSCFETLFAARVAAIAGDLDNILIDCIATVVAAITRVADNGAGASVMRTFLFLRHNDLLRNQI